MNLNPEQEQAANHRDGPCIVTACPGSGKTRVIVERTARMIQSGVEPKSLLCITFTNKAAAEMKERVLKRIGEDSTDEIFIATFHRLCSTILRYHGNHLGYSRYLTIMDDDGQIDLMSQCARQLELELTKPMIKKILYNINESRENLESSLDMAARFDAIDPQFYRVAEEYISRLRAANSIDFSGLLSETVRLLTDYPEVLEKAQSRWKYFMVDEVQDTNFCQFRLVEIISSHTKNVLVVGDLDQSIYGWRGARSENIRDFQRKFPGTKIISLGKNYRSTPQIVAVADKLIRHNTDRIAANFTTDNPSGSPVACRVYLDDREESNHVARAIQNAVHGGRCTYKDVAVLYRINSMSRAIEMALINNGIPHTLIGGFSFFDRKEVKDCISMLKFLINPADGVSFHRIANKPKRALGDITVGKIETAAVKNGVNIMEAIAQMDFKSETVKDGLGEVSRAFNVHWKGSSIAENLNHLIETLRYKEYLDVDDPDTAVERKQNVDELIRDAARFGVEKSNDIGAYLEQIALLSNYDKSADGDAVSLMSLHGSKGLEFPVVFMLGVEQNILPHKMAISDREDGLEEERRLCYVGMTRAQKVLNVSYCARRQENGFAKGGQVRFKPSQPSQFLFESGLVDLPKASAAGTNFDTDRLDRYERRER
jgi:DNA helicase-2/ATP-dependent DNA helicase PcrA